MLSLLTNVSEACHIWCINYILKVKDSFCQLLEVNKLLYELGILDNCSVSQILIEGICRSKLTICQIRGLLLCAKKVPFSLKANNLAGLWAFGANICFQ